MNESYLTSTAGSTRVILVQIVTSLILYTKVWTVAVTISIWKAVAAELSVSTCRTLFIAERGKNLLCPPPKTNKMNVKVNGIFVAVLFLIWPLKASCIHAPVVLAVAPFWWIASPSAASVSHVVEGAVSSTSLFTDYVLWNQQELTTSSKLRLKLNNRWMNWWR